jgi:hypothetical protein
MAAGMVTHSPCLGELSRRILASFSRGGSPRAIDAAPKSRSAAAARKIILLFIAITSKNGPPAWRFIRAGISD